MPTNDKTRYQAAPVVDEWGIYDPDRAGLAAVFARVDANERHPLKSRAAAMATALRRESDLTKTK